MLIKMRSVILAAAAAGLLLTNAAPVRAFSDLTDAKQAEIVQSLQDKGLIQGVTTNKFAPNNKLTNAQAVQLIVNAIDLDSVKKKNNAPAWYASVPANAWYASTLKTALERGVTIDGDWNAGGNPTREQFAKLLYLGLLQKGNYAKVTKYATIADAKQIASKNRMAIEYLLLTKIASLDKNKKFRPTAAITRIEAAEMIYGAERMVNKSYASSGKGTVTYKVENVDPKYNKVTLTRSNLPGTGYGLKINKVEFVSDTDAVITYTLTSPAASGTSYPASDYIFVPVVYDITVKENG
ncbi:S-layer homology domain-containing protein [Saccharibacillus sp. CPCC 101409]|uniref:S-layer homology domain-containing protein n=1 Tax=Saccharibacillus sp. CPCC 101409 TaxID=3058041 RepID=UPI002670FEE8|nr:S-layer homology domain-containing protein [Saccharibacillus sp. CPCC 101409]MDO3411215.1 S-layer homology domain-containing protein [Saccharibacillus sp. CPCC 101409]